jgi:hypothetical protein
MRAGHALRRGSGFEPATLQRKLHRRGELLYDVQWGDGSRSTLPPADIAPDSIEVFEKAKLILQKEKQTARDKAR